jgi:hypothetical protein
MTDVQIILIACTILGHDSCKTVDLMVDPSLPATPYHSSLVLLKQKSGYAPTQATIPSAGPVSV